MFDDSVFNPHRAVQRVSDWFEQRKAYRLQALLTLRKREGLPSPVDIDGNPLETRYDDQGQAHYYRADGKRVDPVYWQGAGKDGKPGAFAVGPTQGRGEGTGRRPVGRCRRRRIRDSGSR